MLTIDPRADEIRAAILAQPKWTDRQIAAILGINRWSRVTRQREQLTAAPEPPDPALVCPHESCGFVAKSPGGLGVHDARSHRRPAALADELAAPVLAEPVAILADDVPVETDTPPARQLVITANPTIICLNCSRVGTPSPERPTWCKACAASAEGASWRERTLWQCECGRPFARSTSDPTQCIKCSGEYDRAARRHRSGAIFAAAD